MRHLSLALCKRSIVSVNYCCLIFRQEVRPRLVHRSLRRDRLVGVADPVPVCIGERSVGTVTIVVFSLVVWEWGADKQGKVQISGGRQPQLAADDYLRAFP